MAKEVGLQDNTTRDSIKAMMRSGMKNAYEYDGNGRVHYLYQAPLHLEIGDPCLRTHYKYFDGDAGTSRVVLAFEEEVVAWPGYLDNTGTPIASNDITDLP